MEGTQISDGQGSATSGGPRAVLVLTDDDALSAMGEVFVARGFRFECQRHLPSGLTRALDRGPSLVIVDAALLNENALGVLRQIRLRSSVPLVMLAAEMDRSDRIASLEAGADDYWVRPLDFDEVLARVHALLRRSGLSPTPAGPIGVSGVSLDPVVRLVNVDGRTLEVTSLEYALLDYLVRAAGRVVSRDELMTVIVQREPSPFDRSLDVHISRLRKKLGQRRRLLRTVRGVGYVFCSDEH
jgi:two-component system response regulator CpxR